MTNTSKSIHRMSFHFLFYCNLVMSGIRGASACTVLICRQRLEGRMSRLKREGSSLVIDAAFCFLSGARDSPLASINDKSTDVIIKAIVSFTQNGPLYLCSKCQQFFSYLHTNKDHPYRLIYHAKLTKYSNFKKLMKISDP